MEINAFGYIAESCLSMFNLIALYHAVMPEGMTAWRIQITVTSTARIQLVVLSSMIWLHIVKGVAWKLGKMCKNVLQLPL